jgi:hypothetical protein
MVPEGEIGRFAGDEMKYNKIAGEIMQKHGVLINDLHQLSSSLDRSLFRKPVMSTTPRRVLLYWANKWRIT